MKAVLICPSACLDAPLLAGDLPLTMTPALGRGLAEYWLSYLACAGMKEVSLRTSQQADELRALLGGEDRWGMAVEVAGALENPSPGPSATEIGAEVFVADHFPGFSDKPLFGSYADWFHGLMNWMPRAKTLDRVGVRELQPGVWAGLHGHISPAAKLRPPCWLGDHIYVGPSATIGPNAIVENGVFIEPKASIQNSIVGPSTFVGQYVQLDHSLVWGATLVNWQSGLISQVSDSFLLCSLLPKPAGPKGEPLLGRVARWIDAWTPPPLRSQPILVKK